MNKYNAVFCGLIGLIVSFLLIPVIRKRFLSFSQKRGRQLHQTHKVPICRFGGIALAASFAIVGGFRLLLFPQDGITADSHWLIYWTGLAMFALGFFDDIRPIGAKKKMLGQLLIASIVYFAGLRIETIKNPLSGVEYSIGPWGYLATVFWLVTFTNLINLIDGIDGLAAGISLMLMSLIAYIGLTTHSFSFYVAVGMAGALLGFLYYNFPPAKIYMGDGGAYFLGFLIGVLTIENSHKGPIAASLIAPLFALALPIVDVGIAIVRRALKGLPIFRPDRKHIHHRLVATGFSKVKSVIVLYSLSLIFLAFAFFVFWTHAEKLPFLFGLMCLTLLAAAGSIDFGRDWLALGKAVGNSLEMRRETRYALRLSQWFELEAERSESIERLWIDYQFVARKLEFLEVTLVLQTGPEATVHLGQSSGEGESLQIRHEIHIGNVIALEFKAPPQSLANFELMSELATEIWIKGLHRWQSFHELPIAFGGQLESKKSLSRIKSAAAPSPSVADGDVPGPDQFQSVG